MKLIALIILLLPLPYMSFAQQHTKDTTGLATDSIGIAMDSTITVDSVDIRGMVQEQITAAKKKMLEEKKSPAGVLINKKKALKESNIEEPFGIVNKIRELFARSNENIASVALLAGSTFLVFGTVLLRRFKIKKKNIRHKKLVKNINSIREEKVAVKNDPKLKSVRTKLKSNPEQFSGENALTQTAKELNISKGELMLAAKIKSYELSKIS